MSDLKLINAPAGSGKSTEIKARVNAWAMEHPLDKLLCVTYTNRAANELKQGISSPSIDVQTIHSFMNSFSKSLFSAPEIVEYYFETYGEAIRARIENAEGDSRIEESNARYREKINDPLTYEAIVQSVSFLKYNETPFNTLYRGGLSHDDLLSFIALAARKFPAIYKRISTKYRQIIIDEYQDTNVDVLEFFIATARSSPSLGLHLYGDRMQQIYRSDPSRFQEIIQNFDIEKREVKNFRSSEAIVTVLNNIYDDENFTQVCATGVVGSKPRVHITNSVHELEEKLADESTIVLTVHNSSIFRSIGALELFRGIQSLPEHGYNTQYPAADVLTEKDREKIPNALIRLLYGLLDLEDYHGERKIGTLIQELRKHPKEFGLIAFSTHRDKSKLSGELESLFSTMRDPTSSIQSILEKLAVLELEKPANIDGFLEDEAYQEILAIPFLQVRNTHEYRLNPTRSTQHGVKGEGHDKVIFIAETSHSTPMVGMKRLFELWPKYAFTLQELEEFLATVDVQFRGAIEEIGADISKLKAPEYAPYNDATVLVASRISETLSSSRLFAELYGEAYAKFLARPNVSNAKSLFKTSPIDGLLSAYKLFYVGCSRARSELDVIVSTGEIADVEAMSAKFQSLGFEVHFADAV
ncbi:MAG: UvrD-helicase domain-containing protein [Leucobacter sp.]